MGLTETLLRFSLTATSAVTACGSLAQVQAAEHDMTTLAGVYEVQICKLTCATSDDGTVVVRGYLVLFSEALSRSELARFPSTHVRHVSSPNACFMLEKVPGRAYAGYAGINKSGLTTWSVTSAELTFSLMRSADAGYKVSVRSSVAGFDGEGTSWGVGAAAPPEPGPDHVRLRRVGRSDVRRCERG